METRLTCQGRSCHYLRAGRKPETLMAKSITLITLTSAPAGSTPETGRCVCVCVRQRCCSNSEEDGWPLTSCRRSSWVKTVYCKVHVRLTHHKRLIQFGPRLIITTHTFIAFVNIYHNLNKEQICVLFATLSIPYSTSPNSKYIFSHKDTGNTLF